MLDMWRENWILRLIVVLVIWAMAVAAYFVFKVTLTGFLFWATIAGFIIAGLSLFLSPILDNYA